MANLAAYLLSRARAQPLAPALSFGTQSRSYGEIAERVRRMAGGLRREARLAPGSRVVLWMENRIEFFELLFACWTVGLCPVPVNAKLHGKEVAHVIRDCAAGAVFTSESLLDGLVDELPGIAPPPQLYLVGSPACEALAGAPAADCARLSPTDLAWIFYTSGTTGRPKGAMLSHRNLLAMSWIYYADIERVEPGDVKLHAAPLSHGSGLYGLPHLLAGGHQVIHDGFEPQAVLEAFEQHRNLTIFAAPTMVTRLVAAAGAGGRFPGLRTLYYGGGPMYVSDLLKALDLFGPRLYQLYGQGESPMTISGLSKREHEGPRDAAHLARLGSCGTPRIGVEVRVVDEEGRELSCGEPGEVVTRSDCVMSGYWNNPGATSSALRDGWLWTGDVGSVDERGYLTLRDRSKDMIISGGTNIYPREIEEVLLRHPGILECSVVGRPHADWGEAVIAFVVAQPGATLATRELDDLCLANIARFKRPREYRFVESLPKNNYGKVLKTRLRQILSEEKENA
jgi:acyl-CoA synthetase (AMP-forming)/AMP-acid ligase II